MVKTRFNNCSYDVLINKSLKLFSAHDNMRELPCISTLRLMNSALDDGIHPDNNLICSYYDSISNGRNCCDHSLSKIIEFTNRIFKLKIVNDEILCYISQFKELDVCFEHFTYITSDDVQLMSLLRLNCSHNDNS